MIASMVEMTEYLARIQTERHREIRCELSMKLSSRLNDAALREMLLTGLPMAQGVQMRSVRSRGRGVVLTAKIRYREGVRMLDAVHGLPLPLTERETAALDAAQRMAEKSCLQDEEARFREVYGWLCQNVRYVHTAPGAKGYEQLVGASGAILRGEANCQGFADALYLLCGLCGIPAVYRCGPGERQLHVWNEICIGGTWRIADASKGARNMNV